MQKYYYIYILTNHPNGTLYIGVTANLVRRVWQHKEALTDGFTKRYHIKKLVYYELHYDIDTAIEREKKLKKWRRQWKIELIEKFNPAWDDLFNQIIH